MQDCFRLLFLPVEITAREIDAKQNICAIALKHGFTVYIGSKTSVANLAIKVGFGVYLGKDHGPQSFSQYENLVWRVLIFIVWMKRGSSFIHKRNIQAS